MDVDDERAAQWYIELNDGLRKMTAWEHEVLEGAWANGVTDIFYDWLVKYISGTDRITQRYKLNLVDMTQTNDSTGRPATLGWTFGLFFSLGAPPPRRPNQSAPGLPD